MQSRGAQHKMTYKIYAEFYRGEIADITYVPQQAYYNIPFQIINGFYYVGPEFLIIDIYRQYIKNYPDGIK